MLPWAGVLGGWPHLQRGGCSLATPPPPCCSSCRRSQGSPRALGLRRHVPHGSVLDTPGARAGICGTAAHCSNNERPCASIHVFGGVGETFKTSKITENSMISLRILISSPVAVRSVVLIIKTTCWSLKDEKSSVIQEFYFGFRSTHFKTETFTAGASSPAPNAPQGKGQRPPASGRRAGEPTRAAGAPPRLATRCLPVTRGRTPSRCSLAPHISTARDVAPMSSHVTFSTETFK